MQTQNGDSSCALLSVEHNFRCGFCLWEKKKQNFSNFRGNLIHTLFLKYSPFFRGGYFFLNETQEKLTKDSSLNARVKI